MSGSSSGADVVGGGHGAGDWQPGARQGATEGPRRVERLHEGRECRLVFKKLSDFNFVMNTA